MATSGLRDNFSGVLRMIAPTGGVTQGKMYVIGNTQVVAMETASATVLFDAAVVGCVWVLKYAATGITFLAGAKAYYDATNHRITNAATGNTLVGGFVVDAAAATDTSAKIYLTGQYASLT